MRAASPAAGLYKQDKCAIIRFVKLIAQLKLLPTPEQADALLSTRHGETDLAFVRGAWHLFAVCDVDEPDPQDVDDVIGIDLGITNIAVDSDGAIHSGRACKSVRYRHRQLPRRTGQRRRVSNAFGVAALVMPIQSLPGTFVFSVGLPSCSRTSRRAQGALARDKPRGFSPGGS